MTDMFLKPQQPVQPNINQENQFFAVDTFGGMNVLARRYGIEDGEFSYLENLMPLTPHTLRALPGVGAALAALPVGQVVSRFWHVVVGPGAGVAATNWLIVSIQQGNLYAYNLDLVPVLSPVKINGAVAFSQPDVTTWQGTQLLVVDPSAGYYSFAVTGTGLGAAFSSGVSLTPPATPLTLIAVAFGRVVVVANNTTYIFSAPASYTDFTVGNGAVSNTIVNDSLRKTITRLILNGDYLCILGDGAMYAVSNMQANGAHLLSEVFRTHGTPFYAASASIERSVVFGAPDSIYAATAFAPKNITEKLAPFFHSSLDTQTLSPCLSLATIFGKQVLLLLVRYNDPSQGQRSIFIATMDGRNFLLSQGINFTYSCTVELNGTFTTYATDGTSIYPCFSATDGLSPTWRATTKFYALGAPYALKAITRSGILTYLTSNKGTFALTTQTELGSHTISQFALQPLIFVGTGPISWTGAGGAPLSFVGEGTNLVGPDAAQLRGRYIGWDVQGTVFAAGLEAFLAEVSVEAPWLGGGT